MMPHYRKEMRYPRTITWSIAAMIGIVMWWLLIKGLSAIGACVLRSMC